MIIDDVQAFSRDFINFKSFRTSGRKAKIREAYKYLTGKEIRVSCSTCYLEALFEIINSKPMASRNYELKRGVLLQAFGDASKTCTNDTLTDELAEWYLKNQPEKIIYFSKLPAGMQVIKTQEEQKRKLFTGTRNFAKRVNIPETKIVAPSKVAAETIIIPAKVYPEPVKDELKVEPPQATTVELKIRKPRKTKN